MQDSTFKIYNASAGSGKTYALSKAYLKIVLSSPNSFKRILAITFTNKAVNEMKNRILESLFEFSKVNHVSNAPPLFLDLMRDMDLSVESLQKTSKVRLKEILHNYAFFDISTIDKFTHRLIRTFANDLKIPQNFEVILDTELLLEEAVANVISKAGEDKILTNILMNFAFEKIDNNGSWDIGYDLQKIGKLLFDENNVVHLKKLSNKELPDFQNLQVKLRLKIADREKHIIAIANDTLDYISTTGLDISDFPRGTLPNHFTKIKEGQFEPINLYNNQLEANLKDGKIVKASVTLPNPEIPTNLLQFYLSIKELIYNRSLLVNIYKNFVPLTLLSTIDKELKKIQKEKDQLSISEFNTIISEEIKNQPAPFIYERLGEKYRHYFIDEFQDTSEMQWNNLVPLIGNALEGQDDQGNSGSLFLVGDAKQAIYRWRGGKAEQFLDLATGNANPFSIKGNTQVLPKNYRSKDEIITFNNRFFNSISFFLEDESYKDFFKKGNQQETNNKPGGFVKLSFLEEALDENYANQTLQAIKESLSKGFGYGDICIILRKKKHATLIADFLLKEDIPIISSESLLLSSSYKVQFLVYLAKFTLQPTETGLAYELLNLLANDKIDQHAFIQKNVNQLEILLASVYKFDSYTFKQLSLFDSMEYAIKTFDLAPSSDAHLFAFMDAVFEVEQKHGADLQSFLDFWDKKGEKLSVSMPETNAAVQIMTIHKSKGLEFPVVIFPYANTNIYEEIDPKLWVPVKPESYEGFEELLISKKKEVQEYGTNETQIFQWEQNKLQLDAFNLLYVVLTRAVDSLYIICPLDIKRDGTMNTDYFSGLFVHFLSDLGIWTPDEVNYTFGNLERNEPMLENHDEHFDIPYIYTNRDRESFNIITKTGMLWDTDQETALDEGNKIHYILGYIENDTDIEKALTKSIHKGIIDINEVDLARNKVQMVIAHPEIKKYFDQDNTVYNEKEILLSNGGTLRPDRVVIREGKVHIIDYKTGDKNSKYHHQLNNYAQCYETMGYKVENKIIVYINNTVVTEFI
ncbi:UvrD-helicase domain-containing protein [Maribacter sp. CXY002]|uniref:UvrD-helicase domain-containing protein n=1 Tax=Maribacter luteocoastalis TaxID=3407671 RepID=UPI003B66E629